MTTRNEKNGERRTPRMQRYLEDYFESCFRRLEENENSDCIEIDLPAEELEQMSDLLLSFPEDAQNLLFGEYCFNMSYESIGVMFDIDMPKGKSFWYKRLLTDSAGYDTEYLISNDSLKAICQRSLNKFVRNIENEVDQGRTIRVSNNTRHKIRKALLSLVAAAVIISFGFAATLSVNAGIRERVVNWFVETFPQFSIFNSHSEVETSMEELMKYEPEVEPAGYFFVDKIEIDDGIDFIYGNDMGEAVDILITLPSDNWMINTEDMIVEEIDYSGENIYFYSNNEQAALIASKDGYPIYIIGLNNKQECIHILENIKKVD